MKKQILINDANILVDIVKELRIVKEFLKLDYDLCTTDFVKNELTQSKNQQANILQAPLFDTDKIIIKKSSVEDLLEINKLNNQHISLSIADCSVLYYGINLKSAILLTRDKKLSSVAKKLNVEVKDTEFIILEMKKQKLLSEEKVYQCLEILKKYK